MEREAENERQHCLQGVVAHACAYNKKNKNKKGSKAKQKSPFDTWSAHIYRDIFQRAPLTGKWRSRLTDNEATDGAADRERIFSNDPLLDSVQDSQIVSLDMVSTQNSTSAFYAEQQLKQL